MKYIKEFKECKTKEEFIKLMRTRKRVKKSTALRRWYEYKKILSEKSKPLKSQVLITPTTTITDKVLKPLPLRNEPRPVVVEQEHIEFSREPDVGKMLIFNDMKRYNIKITVGYLIRYGFKDDEIAWLKQEGLL